MAVIINNPRYRSNRSSRSSGTKFTGGKAYRREDGKKVFPVYREGKLFKEYYSEKNRRVWLNRRKKDSSKRRRNPGDHLYGSGPMLPQKHGGVSGVEEESMVAYLLATEDELDPMEEFLGEMADEQAALMPALSNPRRRPRRRRNFRDTSRLGHGALRVPTHIPETDRSAAEGLYIFPRDESFPIGDLFHARLALIYAAAPSHEFQRAKVLRAVARAYPEYNWASWWNNHTDHNWDRSI